jgi:hypothetical protein
MAQFFSIFINREQMDLSGGLSKELDIHNCKHGKAN